MRQFSFVIACFSCFVAIASFLGAFVPAAAAAHFRAPSDWHMFLVVLANGVLAGAFLGAICGLLSVLGLRVSGGKQPGTPSDRALNILQTPLFTFGAATGVLIGALTAARFHAQWIWLWWRMNG